MVPPLHTEEPRKMQNTILLTAIGFLVAVSMLAYWVN